MKDNENFVGNILVEFCMVEACIKSIVLDVYGIDSINNNRRSLLNKFYYHINNRVHGHCKSTDKIYKDNSGNDISLEQLVKKLCNIRDIAAHQTVGLVSGWSKIPANQVLMKRNTSGDVMARVRLENTILTEDDYKVVISQGRGKSSLYGNSYVGSAEDLHNDWIFYSKQMSKIFEIWNENCFEIFDINGAQIAEY